MSPPIARRSAVARAGQLALIACAVTLSVALSVASFEFADLMGRALGTTEATTDATAESLPAGTLVLSTRSSAATAATALDDDLIDRVRDVDGVLEATGTYDQPISFHLQEWQQPERPAALRGVVFAEVFAAPWEIVEGKAPSGPDEIAIDAGAAVVGQTTVGALAELELPTGRRFVRVVGLASTGGSEAVDVTAVPALSDAHVLFDQPAIAMSLGAEGRVDRITVVPEPGVDQAAVTERVEAVAGDGVRVTATTDPTALAQQTVATIDDGVRQGTRMFALLTVIVAVVVVANVYAVVLAPRSRELALLRLVGASRARLVRWLLAEALAVGLVASAAGLALGIPLGSFAAGLVPAGGVSLGSVVTTEMLVVAPAVGLGVTLVGALLPVRRASGVAPIAALGDRGDGRRGVNHLAGRLVGGGIGLLGTGLARIVPGHARAVPAMASASVRRRPAATAAAASTMIVGLVLVGAVAVAGASIRAGLANRFRAESSADAYVERRGVVRVDRDALMRQIVRDGVPIAELAEKVSVDGLLVAGDETHSAVVAATLESIEPVIDLGVETGTIGGPGEVLLSEAAADSLAVEVGDPVTLRSTSGDDVTLVVGATYSKTAFYGPAIVHLSDAQAVRADGTFELAAVAFSDGVDERWNRWQLRSAADRFPRVSVHSPERYSELNTSVADTVLRIVGVLLFGAVGIGAVGLAATLALGVMARTTELSRLRAIGATRSQVQSLVTTEAMLVCLGAAIWGLAIGGGIGWWALRFAPPELVTERIVPWPVLLAVAAGTVLLGTVVSLLPARRAAALPPIDAASVQAL